MGHVREFLRGSLFTQRWRKARRKRYALCGKQCIRRRMIHLFRTSFMFHSASWLFARVSSRLTIGHPTLAKSQAAIDIRFAVNSILNAELYIYSARLLCFTVPVGSSLELVARSLFT
jgi:hypothetical protein